MDNQPTFAGFWVRLVATIIDIVIIIAITAPLLFYIYGPEYWDINEHSPFVRGTWDVVITYVFPFVATIFFWIKLRATPGKLLMGLQVVDASSYDNMDLGQSFIRYIAYVLAILPLGIGLFWIAFDSRKQGWHDKLARSVVIKE